MHYIEVVYFSPQYEFAVSPDSSNSNRILYLYVLLFNSIIAHHKAAKKILPIFPKRVLYGNLKKKILMMIWLVN